MFVLSVSDVVMHMMLQNVSTALSWVKEREASILDKVNQLNIKFWMPLNMY